MSRAKRGKGRGRRGSGSGMGEVLRGAGIGRGGRAETVRRILETGRRGAEIREMSGMKGRRARRERTARSAKGEKGEREKEVEAYRGHFCAKCGKRAGECAHGSLFFYIDPDGEQVGAG